MRGKYRIVISVAVLLMLAAFVLLGRWTALRRAAPSLTPLTLTVNVTSGADRGSGTLREALFLADAAPTAASIVIHVNKITLETALPPIVNPHGIQIAGPPDGVDIDTHALSAGSPVLDVDAQHASLSGLLIRQCAGTAILVRAAQFRLASSTIQSCDVGIEVAGNARDVALERNHFDSNRIGARFTATSRDTVVVKNEFTGNKDAGLWLVAGQPDISADPINVHDNQFSADGADVVVGNISTVLEHNDFTKVREAAVHVVGAGAVVRNNHISGGSAAGIVVENASGAVIDGNELDHLAGYGILLRGSSDTLVRANRIHSCGYGMAFVLGDEHRPNTAVDNTLIDLKYNGIDVIGDSPILRRNQVLQARVQPLHVQDFTGPNGAIVHAVPLLEKNSFQLGSTAVATQSTPQH